MTGAREEPGSPRYTHPCEECGREIAKSSETCANCLMGGRKPTLADFGGGSRA